MAGNTADEVVVGGTGRVLVAPYSTGLVHPTDVTTAFNAAWIEVGFVSEDGVTFTDGKDIEDIEAWQSFYPIRKVVSKRNTSIEFVMRQWNKYTAKLAFGGGSITLAAGVATYVPPSPGVLDERAMAIEWTDGAYTYRLIMPKGIVTGEVSPNIVRTAAADLPISFEASPAGSPTPGQPKTYPWYVLTNAPAFLSAT